ncbi:NAD-dependent epimerase/dehydratase family protein [Alkalihalobacillus sp. AL-G]|uniref:NAD-dependent epimerase/dehydratase family protein n=1 Tax=Alkalihalobacillus sp. AL-G TaxID=2926399 RepID=UPI00272A4566|nr:NAD-dependent epimerase/dehydratase family protein [Alkalihalobacillus sp. AL-G]WLD92847.1 NAD-dependent epimerase/dehydratase family protein [Alkalihalobacillus sp. AL-G]
MGRILVMGGTEFVSKALVVHLISKGYQVDILTRGKREVDYQGVHIHYICNRKDKNELSNTLNDTQYDYVYDISAYTEEDVRIFTGVINTEALKRYVFCSSGAVYKPSESRMSEIAEKDNNPNWGQYGEDKKNAEDYLIQLYNSKGFPIVIFRPPYIYGEGNNLYREAFLFERIQNKLPIPYPGDDNTLVQFVHIDDLVNVFSSAIDNDCVGQIFNLAYPEDISWRQLIKIAASVIEQEVPSVRISTTKMNEIDVVPREFFPFRDCSFLMSIEKLKNSGLYSPKINLRNGMLKAYQWYQGKQKLPQYRKMPKVDYVIENTK